MEIKLVFLAAFLTACSCIMSSESYADTIFEVYHKAHPSYQELSKLGIEYKPFLTMEIKKNNNAHSSKVPNLSVGKTYRTSTVSVPLFAPDSSGNYTITTNCYRTLINNGIHFNSFISGKKEIYIPQDGSTLQIEATCPLSEFGTTLPEISIKINKDYIVGGSTYTTITDFVDQGSWRYDLSHQKAEIIKISE